MLVTGALALLSIWTYGPMALSCPFKWGVALWFSLVIKVECKCQSQVEVSRARVRYTSFSSSCHGDWVNVARKSLYQPQSPRDSDEQNLLLLPLPALGIQSEWEMWGTGILEMHVALPSLAHKAPYLVKSPFTLITHHANYPCISLLALPDPCSLSGKDG